MNQGPIKEQYTTFFLPKAKKDLANELAKPVKYARFCQLWRVLYPRAINREHCRIIGSCETCGWQERGRKSSTNDVSFSKQ